MKPLPEIEENQNLVRQYLLGDLEGEKREQFEERLFADSEYYEQVLMIEEELIEDFVFHLLPPADERKFADHFLTTPRQVEKVRTVKALKEYSDRVAETLSRKDRFFTFLRERQLIVAFSFASIVVAGLASIWILTRVSIDQEVARLNAASSPELNLGINQSDEVVNLLPIRTRSRVDTIFEDEQSISLFAGKPVVQLRLPLSADEYREYQVTLQTDPDSRIFTLGHLQASNTVDGKILVVRVPAHILSPGEYQLLASGRTQDDRTENLGSYVFRIVKANK